MASRSRSRPRTRASAPSSRATVRAWFPTFIYEAPLLSRPGALNRSLLADCYKLREVDEDGLRWCRTNYPDGYTSYASYSRLHQTFSAFTDLARHIDGHVRAFARALDFAEGDGRHKLEMTDCWVNVMPRHAVHALHLHPLSTISGTYYVKTPPGCSRIRFEDPRLDRMMAAPPRKGHARPANQQQVSYDVKAGHLVLFESWLRHEVRPSTVDDERVSVSFNYNWF
jgi:uncharacterized protein (TIGR02466 family)